MELELGFRLGHWEVYPLRNVVSRAEASLRLEGKAIHVLMVLAQHPGEVVTRRTLLEEVWQDRPVSDEVLSRCISLLRSTLGDDPKDPSYIQTIPRTGYRLLASVRPIENLSRRDAVDAGPASLEPGADPGAPPRERLAEPAPAMQSSATPARFLRWIPGLLSLLLAAAIFSWVALRSDGEGMGTAMQPVPPGPGGAIAVLPLRNLSADPEDDYFADGLTDELISRLSDLEGLRVIARTTALGFKGTAEDARIIGRKLGVTHLVTGTVKIADKRLRVTIQLVDTELGIEIASDTYDATIADTFAVQQGMSEAIVQALLPALQDQGWAATRDSGASVPDSQAYLLLLRARHLIKRREEASIRRAIALLEEATQRDPAQPALYLALAKAHALLPYYSAESKDIMFRRAEEIIALGRTRGAHIGDSAEGLAAFIALGRWDWVAADLSFTRAMAAEPGDADLYQWRSEFYASVGRPDLSVIYAIRASELDALSPVVNDRLAVAYLWLNEDTRARSLFHDASLLGFGFTANPGSYLISLLRSGEDEKAAQLLYSLQSLGGGSTEWIALFMAARKDPASRAEATAALEAAAAARTIDPRFLFGAWIYLGEMERAMLLAEHMTANTRALDVEFLFARETREFRQHPRFGALLADIGLDHYWDVAGWPSWCARDHGEIRCVEPAAAINAPPGAEQDRESWARK